MNKTDLVQIVTEGTGSTKAAAERTVNAIIDGIKNEIIKGGEVQLIGFGTFKLVERKERKAKNIQTGESITVPACKTPTFKVSAAWKGACN